MPDKMTVVDSFHSVLDRNDWTADDLRLHLAQLSCGDSLNDSSSFRDPPLIRVLQSDKCTLDLVRLLLAGGASVHQGAPLTVAARNCDVDIIRELLLYGASAQDLDKFGRSCVCNALQAGAPPSVFRLLLDAGCSPDLCSNHVSVLHCASFQPGLSTEVLRMFLNTGADILRPGASGQSPLCFALRAGLDASGLKLVLEAGASLDSCSRHATSLVCATHQDWGRTLRADVVRTLLQAGATTECTTRWTPLHFALRYLAYETDAVKALLDVPGVNVNGPGVGWKHDSLLHLAVHNSHCTLAMVRLLLNRGAKVDKVNRQGDTPLHYAVANEECQLSVIQFLIQRRASVNVRNKYSKTPLFVAIVAERSIEVLHILLGAGARIGMIKDKMTYSLLSLAVGLYEERLKRSRSKLQYRDPVLRSHQGLLAKKDKDSQLYLSFLLERVKVIATYSFLESTELTTEYLFGRWRNSPELLEFAKKCLEEVKEMATTDVGRGHTLLEFLTSRSRCSKKAKSKFYKLSHLLAVVHKFPIFFTVIAEKVGVESLKASLRYLKVSATKQSVIEESRISAIDETGRMSDIDESWRTYAIDEPRRMSVIDESWRMSGFDDPRRMSGIDEPRRMSGIDEPRRISVIDESRRMFAIDEPRRLSVIDESRTIFTIDEPRRMSAIDESWRMSEFDEPRRISVIDESCRMSGTDESRRMSAFDESKRVSLMDESRKNPAVDRILSLNGSSNTTVQGSLSSTAADSSDCLQETFCEFTESDSSDLTKGAIKGPTVDISTGLITSDSSIIKVDTCTISKTNDSRIFSEDNSNGCKSGEVCTIKSSCDSTQDDSKASFKFTATISKDVSKAATNDSKVSITNDSSDSYADDSKTCKAEDFKVFSVDDSSIGQHRVHSVKSSNVFTVGDSGNSNFDSSSVSLVMDSKVADTNDSTVDTCIVSFAEDTSKSSRHPYTTVYIPNVCMVDSPSVSLVDAYKKQVLQHYKAKTSGNDPRTAILDTSTKASRVTIPENDPVFQEQRVDLNHECLCDVARFLSASDLMNLVLAFRVPCNHAVEDQIVQLNKDELQASPPKPSEKQSVINTVQSTALPSCSTKDPEPDYSRRMSAPLCSKHKPSCPRHGPRNPHEPYWKKKKKRRNSSLPSSSNEENQEIPPKRRQKKRKRNSCQRKCKLHASNDSSSQDS